jgi:gliding motility-associated-like protein
MKKIVLSITVFFAVVNAFANHITGGEMYYTLTGQSGTSYSYHVTLKLYRDCNSTGAQLDDSAPIAVFNNSGNTLVSTTKVPRTTIVIQNLSSPSPCIQNPPLVCYQVGYYEFDVTLGGSVAGYTIAYQRCCRIAGINNLIGSSSVGATYTCEIPGTSAVANAPANNSAHFFGVDTVIVCAKNYFCYNFGASDPDKDSLSYSYCEAYVGGSTSEPAPATPAQPPYSPVPYSAPYFSEQPLGPGVSLDPRTGMMCGTAPSPGIYVITVCVTEYRKGIRIATQRKDLQIKIGDCNIAASVPIAFDSRGIQVNPDYSTCNGYVFNFQNQNPNNPLVHTYYWEFGDGGSSTASKPAHTYTDTGAYRVKLVINRGEDCSDSSTTILRIYPGFFPGFTFAGICANHPTLFADNTKATFGVVNYWSWDFGNPSASADTSNLKSPAYTYPVDADYNVRLIVKTSKNCIDTVYKTVSIIDKPPINVAFKDTLICKGDTLQLHAVGNGTFSWTPVSSIVNENTADPTVNPAATVKYFVQLNDNGCVNRDTVNVRVINQVTLLVMPDTTICSTDILQLKAVTDGLKFQWSPATTLNNATILSPIANPLTTTTYQLISSVGHCSTTDSVVVTLVPYPVANAGPDTTICYNASAQLHASIVGSTFSWSPANSLNNANSLAPIATPTNTTPYILTVYDNKGCPKPGSDTLLVTVLPKVNAFAGRDTAVVVGEPLQFNASGGISYQWTPATSLSNSTISNPRAEYDGSFDSIRYYLVVKDENGCSDEAQVSVRIFKTNPQIFVPTAFTPNGDGINDVFKPIPVGITTFEYFRVYNRWGQLVFSTSRSGAGWDGRIGGKDQGTGTFVWLVKGTDFTGKLVFAKGTVTLIR